RPMLVDMMVERVLDHGLDRREARSAGDKDDRLVGFLAQEERPERALETQDLPPLEFAEKLSREETVGYVPDVQFEQRVVVRRRREREAPPAVVLQQQVDELAGEILQPFVRRQLDPDDGDVRRRLVDRFDAARQLADPYVARATYFPHFDDEVGLGLCAAEK